MTGIWLFLNYFLSFPKKFCLPVAISGKTHTHMRTHLIPHFMFQNLQCFFVVIVWNFFPLISFLSPLLKCHYCSRKVLRNQSLYLRICYYNVSLRTRARCLRFQTTIFVIGSLPMFQILDPWIECVTLTILRKTLEFYDSASLGYAINFHWLLLVCLLQGLGLFPKSVIQAASKWPFQKHIR